MKNRFSPAKLLHSKWTAAKPQNKEKHFIVTRLLRGEDDEVVGCILEAVHSKRASEIDYRELRDSSIWLQGWQ